MSSGIGTFSLTEGGGFGVVGGTGDENETERESKGGTGEGSCWVILNKEAKKEKKK